jgi:hypothetical protein
LDAVFYELNDITLVTFRQGDSALDAYFGWATPGGGEPRPYKTRAVTSVVVVVGWAGANLNPHPLKAEGAAPRCRLARTHVDLLGEGGAEAADYSVLAQGHHCVEEWGGDGLADDGDAGGVDEEAGFYAAGLGDGAGGVVAGVVIPLA